MSATPLPVGVGVVGTGFMGRSQSIALMSAPAILDIPVRLTLEHLVDASAGHAARTAHQWGFNRSGNDWRALVDDPTVNLVAIAAPNQLHRPIAMAAAAAGKHVYCEKPLAPSGAAAREMAEAASAAGVKTRVGFQYLANPVVQFARQLIHRGEIGEIRFFRGLHAEDYMADATAPWSWRLDPDGGGGAMADLGSHVLSMARFLVGPVSEVFGSVHTAIPKRPDGGRGRGTAKRPGRGCRAGAAALRERGHRICGGQLDGDGPQDAARVRDRRDPRRPTLFAGALQRPRDLSNR